MKSMQAQCYSNTTVMFLCVRHPALHAFSSDCAGKRIKCPQLHSNGAIILGDAAHAGNGL